MILLRMTKYILKLFFLVLLAFLPLVSSAFDAGFYAPASALASGRWVKVRVDESGMYRIPASTLRQWGFSDPAKVKVYGYGGRRLADLLSADTYADDLPQTPSVSTADGVAFYAAGPLDWVQSTGSYCHGYLNPYSSFGYYFVTETDSVAPTPVTGIAKATNPATTAMGFVHHEVETTRATDAGPLFVGESFANTRTRSFTLATPGRIAGDVWLECSFFHVHKGSAATLKFAVDNAELPETSSDRVPATSDSNYAGGSVGTARHTFASGAGESLNVTVTYQPTVSVTRAFLDYLTVNYERALTLGAGAPIEFWSDAAQLALEAPADAVVWDVTDPTRVMAVQTEYVGGRHQWSVSERGIRAYVAFMPSATMPAPAFDSNVVPQDLHGQRKPVDMVIITPAELIAQANRIAQLHRDDDGMEVEVVDQALIYNEFSSGTPDIGGLRKYLKFVYDSGADSDRPLKYALLLGSATLDHRSIVPSPHYSYRTTPCWLVREARLSMTDNDGYGTDDFLAMLEDGSGTALGLDYLSVAVGRIPMLNADEGNSIIDKLVQYSRSSKKTGWKNRMIILADDEDSGVHLQQAEAMASLFQATERQQHIIDKIYIDAYEKVGSTYPEARREMYRLLDDGASWWIFTGHANDHSWTGESMLTYNDLNSLYLRNLPFVLASTCDFLRWDGDVISGGEIMYKERYGGSISMISATRPVYISDNGLFLKAFGRQALSRDDNGQLVRSGEAYRRTKNDIRNNSGNITSNSNRLRFVFMGDPAMAITTPSNMIEVTHINGVAVGTDTDHTIAALSNAQIKGRVVDPDGEPITGFNGVVLADIFDADYSITTLAHGAGSVEVFDRHGDKLFSGAATVTNGEFTIQAPMPSQIAENWRQATMSLYAYATNSNDEAIGTFRDFYVYGFDEPAQPDTDAPAIESMVLNHAAFRNGDTVNDSPMLIAKVSDNVGVNLSTAGVGQQMSLTLDGFKSFNDVASFFTPSADGSPSGIINYPLDGLTDGAHALTLRVFDTSGNASSLTIDFAVSSKLTPNIFEVFCDASPAHTSASFFVRHDRPDSMMDVVVTVYNLLGQPIWSGSAKGISDMDVSAPVTWNLTDMAGRRVQRGIYLYRASITADGVQYQTASRRIAVAAE